MKIELNDCQRRFWLEGLLHPDSSVNLAAVYRIKGELNVVALRRALYIVVSKVESLHAVYKSDMGGVYLETRPVHQLEIQEKQVADERESEALLKSFGFRLFKLSEEFPIRVLLLQLASQEYRLGIAFHHICTDAISNLDFFRMLSETYHSIVNQEKLPRWELPTFKDYLEIEKKEKGKYAEGLDYWKTFFEMYPTGVSLPFSSSVWDEPVEELLFQLGIRLNKAVCKLARQLHTTPFLVLTTAWQWVLASWSGNRKITVSYAINLRPPTMAGLIGPFVNNLPCGANLEENPSFAEVVMDITRQRGRAKIWQRVMTTDIVEHLRKSGVLHPSDPFLNVAINYVEWGHSQALTLERTKVSYEGRIRVSQHFDLALEVEPKDAAYCRILYKKSFPKAYVCAMKQALVRLLISVTEEPELHFSEFSLLRSVEVKKIICRSSKLLHCLPLQAVSFLQLWKLAVSKHTDRIAVVYGCKRMTYRELDELSDRIGEAVNKKLEQNSLGGLVSGTAVGIWLEREYNYIAAILGVMKAGAAYVPLDPGNPSERLAFIVKDCDIKLIVTSRKMRWKCDSSVLFCIEDVAEEQQPRILPQLSLDSIAYIIYTSGTTGQPKGVPVSYRNLYYLLRNAVKYLKISSNTIQLEYASFSFDASIVDVFPALISGGTVCVASEMERMDAGRLSAFIQRKHINTAYIAPVMLGKISQRLPDLKTIIVAGETTPEEVVRKWAVGRRLLNLYGPTENTVFSTGIRLLPEMAANNIGKPIQGVACYVLDEHRRLLPDWVPGELYIGGVQLTNGYINRPELNQEKFIRNPFVSEIEKQARVNLRLYRTGDRVCRLPNGQLLFMGRVDQQIKIHGLRIEAGEIENCLNRYPGIHQALVIADETGTVKRLVAYVQAEHLDQSLLREFLSRYLPSYMIPVAFVRVDDFPLTPNGKIDRRRLPSPQWENQKYTPPVTTVEIILTAIIRRLLGVEKVGVEDDLFAMGLTSLNSMTFSIEATEAGIPLTVAAIYSGRTIRKIATVGQQGVCFWFREKGKEKPVVVMVCGHHDFGEYLYPLVEKLDQYFDVLIVESYQCYPQLIASKSWTELLAFYVERLEMILPKESEVYAFTGHCFGGEIAYALACIWEQQHPRPLVWLFDALACRKLLPTHQAMLFRKSLEVQSVEIEKRLQLTEKLMVTENLPFFAGEVILFLPEQFTPHLFAADLPALTEKESIEQIEQIWRKNPDHWKKITGQLEIYKLPATHWTMLTPGLINKILMRIMIGYGKKISLKK